MSLRIAVDLDGTLADMESAIAREAERLFGPDVDACASLHPSTLLRASRAGGAPDAERRRLTDRQQRQLWAHLREMDNFWLSLREIEPGAVARLAAAATANRWEVIFLTQRPPSGGETAQLQTQRWLQAYGFELPSVYVLTGSRGAVAAALQLDAVLDDRPENCLDVTTDSQALPFLVWRDTPASVPPGVARLGIEVVSSVAEALERLQRLRPPAAPPVSLIDRLRVSLGI